jgi:RNA polymerase sigma factor (sigma-70 family)
MSPLRDKNGAMSKQDEPQNPIDELLQEKTAANEQRRQKEHGLWEHWNTKGRQPEHLEPLLDSFKPLVAQKVREWAPPMIPQSAFEGELHKHLIHAFETYNPDRGASLSTHVHHRIQKAKRYMNQYQNMAYIPEGKTRNIGQIQKAQNQLTQDFGRPPTHDEIADHIGLPVRKINDIVSSMRKDIPGSSWDTDPNPHMMTREREVLDLLHYNLNPDEKEVFDHVFGLNGKKKMESTKEIAKLLGKSDSQVSRLKTSILNKYNEYK